MKLLIECEHCGRVHSFWVIPFLSNLRKGKLVVFCLRKFRFSTWYHEHTAA